MPRCTPFVAVFLIALVCPIPLPAQTPKPDRAKELEAEIAKLETRLAELRAELDKARPAPKDVVQFLPDRPMSLGQVGVFRHSGGRYFLRVYRVIGKDEMEMRPIGLLTDGGMTPFILRVPTRGVVEGRQMELPGVWEVKDTKKSAGATLFVLEKVSDREPPDERPVRRPPPKRKAKP